MNNRFIHANLWGEKLNCGKKITKISFMMNPFREPENRINHYKYLFERKNLINGKGVRNDKEYKTKYNRPKKDEYSYHLKVRKEQIPTFFQNLCKNRIRDIYNKDGVIISRHFRVMNINSREFPEERKRNIASALYSVNLSKIKSKTRSAETVKNKYNKFFSTELNFGDSPYIIKSDINSYYKNFYSNANNKNNDLIFTPIVTNNKYNDFFVGNNTPDSANDNLNGHISSNRSKNYLNQNRNNSPILKNGVDLGINTINSQYSNNIKKLKEGLTKFVNGGNTQNKKDIMSKTFKSFRKKKLP